MFKPLDQLLEKLRDKNPYATIVLSVSPFDKNETEVDIYIGKVDVNADTFSEIHPNETLTVIASLDDISDHLVTTPNIEVHR